VKQDKDILARASPEALGQRLILAGAPEGFDAFALADFIHRHVGDRSGAGRGRHIHIYVARDDQRLNFMSEALRFFAPSLAQLHFPAWDCLPYDRVSPSAPIMATRLATLSKLLQGDHAQAVVILTTVNAILQRVPPREDLRAWSFSGQRGATIDQNALQNFLSAAGYRRVGTVAEPGDYSLRGGITDIFPSGAEQPLRLDFFGDVLESVRVFDPETQRSLGVQEDFALVPVSEALITPETITRFRGGYVKQFGAVTDNDPLYEAISVGRRHQGAEHWLPLFYETLDTFFDYLPGAYLSFDHMTEPARISRLEQIGEYFDARQSAQAGKSGRQAFGVPVYKALPPEKLYLREEEWNNLAGNRPGFSFSPFRQDSSAGVIDVGGRAGRSFAPERAQDAANVLNILADHVGKLQKDDIRAVLCCFSNGSRERIATLLREHGIGALAYVDNISEIEALPPKVMALAVFPLAAGFVGARWAFISEQDVLGDRLVRAHKRPRRADQFLSEAASLTDGDYVVHVDHGIGRFQGLQTLDVAGAPHDCLLIAYQGGDKLFLPVENIELLSRYGSDEADVQLDRLGSSAWQARKAKLKKRVRDMAEALIKVAAARALHDSIPMQPPSGLYEEFCARFPYEETEDQDKAIADVMDDLSLGRPMDRLICGDVGFGKTEVALRSAFVAAMSGRQVAIVVPTTLLARQHFKTFGERFTGWPLRIGQLSRLVGRKEQNDTRAALATGHIDIVVGTHALLSEQVKFRDLGLLIVDEEQHFGVAHKERLKQMRAEVNVLTMTATPIPRTLQLALTGVRELSLIATPPVDRLAVRTFVGPFDPVVVREAIMREHFRGGQVFYVCPRIADLAEARSFLEEFIPEVKVTTAHGQMSAGQLDDVMNAFYDGRYDVLLSTTIIESGLDIPTANTMVIHRADMFGLAQLYQLRGRVGRSKLRAYAYLTIPADQALTPAAEKRLKVLQSLDALGAGFTMASHDLDIRGAGNLLGEEQSGHIREVGYELYQEMLEEAVANLRAGVSENDAQGPWSPQLTLGTSVLIPENYVPDLDVRLGLYRRLSALEDSGQVDAFAAELIDRFGELPSEVHHLLEIVTIKNLSREAGIARVEAGPKGAVLSFRHDSFANLAGLVAYIGKHADRVKLRPDHKLIYRDDWLDARARLDGTRNLLRDLVNLVRAA
jgi:transcription-repair coupling factor (superfamily II helicase)